MPLPLLLALRRRAPRAPVVFSIPGGMFTFLSGEAGRDLGLITTTCFVGDWAPFGIADDAGFPAADGEEAAWGKLVGPIGDLGAALEQPPSCGCCGSGKESFCCSVGSNDAMESIGIDGIVAGAIIGAVAGGGTTNA